MFPPGTPTRANTVEREDLEAPPASAIAGLRSAAPPGGGEGVGVRVEGGEDLGLASGSPHGRGGAMERGEVGEPPKIAYVV